MSSHSDNLLGPIRAVTMTVPALAPVEAAYGVHLGMRVLARGTVAREIADAWGAPATAGCRYLIMVPEVGEETCLRFIEDPAAGSVAAFATYGWNATEITVQNTDFLAERLMESPFRIIGPPANLKGFEWIRAMQVLGPVGECLYLTDVSTDSTLAHASAMVGQVFIVVTGGRDINAMNDWYRGLFSNDLMDPVAVPIGVLNSAHGLPRDTPQKLGLATLPGGTRIELDQYPPGATARPVVEGHLPPGMSMVTFDVARLPDGARTAPGLLIPSVARMTACVRAPDGEILELQQLPA